MLGRPESGYQYLGLLVLLVLISFGYPFIDAYDTGDVAFSLLTAAIPVAIVVALVRNRREATVALVLAVPAVAAITQNALGLDLVSVRVTQVFPLLLYGYATVVIISHVVNSPTVKLDTLLGAVCGYLMMGYTFSIAYLVTAFTRPGAFYADPALNPDGLLGPHGALTYFSFVTLTTLGYGDIIPVAPIARALASLEATAGVLYMALLVARLVSAYSGREER